MGTETARRPPGAMDITQRPAPTPGALASHLVDKALIQLFVERAAADPARVALRHKHFGIWQEVSWETYRQHVERLALGLRSLGVGAGDRVAVMGDPIPEWMYADLATQSVGGIAYGLYVTTPPDGVRYLLEDGGARVFVAEDQEYVDKLLDAEELAGKQLVQHILVADRQGMFAYRDERICTVADVMARGDEARRAEPECWDRLVEQRTPHEPIRIFYTSGTTGRPKGALVSSSNLVNTWGSVLAGLARTPGRSDRSVSYMPFAHIGETIFSTVLPILFGSVPHLPEDEDGVGEAMVEVSPTLLLAFPRVWETYASQALVDIETGSALKRAAYALAMRARRGLLEAAWAGRRPSPLHRATGGLAYHLVFRHLLNRFGFQKMRFVITGGAPVSPDVTRLWQMWGVRIMELYGMTECGGIATLQDDPTPRPGVAGRAIPAAEVRLADDGEILIRGDGVFHGYWNNPDATAETLDADGWLHTGDLGEFLEDGSLKMIDRKKDVLITALGQVVPASEIEHALKFGPYIRDAMLVGDGRTYLGALLEIDFENVAEWARKEKLLYTSFTNLATNARVNELLQQAVDAANQRLAAAGRPRVEAFRVLPKELDPELGDEITPTRKVKRRQLAEKFNDLVEDMYRTEDSERIARQVGPATEASS